MYVIGIDPGPLPGIARFCVVQGRLLDPHALQITPGLIEPVLQMLARSGRTVVAVERFVVGRRAAQSSSAAAGALTRDMVGVLDACSRSLGVPFTQRSAAEVKPWATDERLDAVGLLELTKGMRHARDAARHALFCAVRDHGLPDPLSRRGGAA